MQIFLIININFLQFIIFHNIFTSNKIIDNKKSGNSNKNYQPWSGNNN
jgi:hypothetical protein